MARGDGAKPPASENGHSGFTPAEVEVLLKACKRYRGAIPTYLQSARTEMEILDAVLRKLAAARDLPDDLS
jgi:hypothetical protein